MQYLGGKSRISKQISEIINRFSKDKDFYSLFCGTCSIESKIVSKSKNLNDYHFYLIELLKAVQLGWEIPDEVSKEEYQRVKKEKDLNPPLTGFIGFACSFGGKWFGGYAKNNSGTNYAKQSKNSLLKKMEGLKTAKFTNKSYLDFTEIEDSVIYCDPPYADTTGYSNSNGFSYEDFWNFCREKSKKNIVFISEIKAPADFIPVWEKPFKRVLDVNKENVLDSIEKLFVHESNYDKIRI